MRTLYFVPLFLLSSIYLSFPRPFSVVADWMSTYHTSTHGVALLRIYDARLKRAARGSLKMQKICKISPRIRHLHEHHRTSLSGYIFATKACIDNRNKIVKQ